MGRVQVMASKIGLPVLAVMAAVGLSAAVAATYVNATTESGVGQFSPTSVPEESTTTSSTSTTVDLTPVTETTAPPPLTAPSTTVTTARARVTTTTVRATTATTDDSETTTTTACQNTGKGNCRSRGGNPPDDD